MYAWIWRKLPQGRAGKLISTLVLLSAVGALLWYVIFPWAEPLLPFDDVQVGDPAGDYHDVGDPGTSPEPSPGDDFDIPYATDEATTQSR
jgi:hypothetical protein